MKDKLQVSVFDVTDENKDALFTLALSMYLGETCQGCGEKFETLESLKDSVWWPHKGGRIGHKACYDKANTK